MEWTVVTVLIAIVGLGVVVVKPIVSATNTLTKLAVVVEQQGREQQALSIKNSDSHRRIWEKNTEQDHRLDGQDHKLDNHEHRIVVLEEK